MNCETTLKAIADCDPCLDGWDKLISYLGKRAEDDVTLPLSVVLDSNGIQDAVWCLRAVPDIEREVRLFAVWCVRRVQHLLVDRRSLVALRVAERYARGAASDDDLACAKRLALKAEKVAFCEKGIAASITAYAAAATTWRDGYLGVYQVVTNVSQAFALTYADATKDNPSAISLNEAIAEFETLQATKFREMFCDGDSSIDRETFLGQRQVVRASSDGAV